jgi:thiol-disulfide isomerase/thioredoxin
VSLLKWVAIVVLSAGLGAAQAAERDFTLSDANGVRHDLKDYRGKWVVVNYWATWCSPCLEEIPDLIKFEDITAQQLAGHVKQLGISYPIMQADPSVNPSFGDVPGLPTTFLINPQGELVAKETGPITATALESYMRRKSAAPAKPPVSPPAAVPSRGL